MGAYCIRLITATLLGTLIGAERSFRRKDAGIRTHSVFALAACLFMILSKYAFFGAQGGADPTMIACQIVMGVNFLGAGIIFRSGQVVSHGLTTAAGVWATAAIGMACGCGLILPATLFTLLVIGLHLFIHRFNIGGTAYAPQEMKLTVINTPVIWEVLKELKQKYRIEVLSARYKRKGNEVHMVLQVQMPTTIPLGEVIRMMDLHKEIKEFSV
ncbi:MAG: MgtC/SapB family protein [Clostridia bacterium]|nr:MgtC/SapB family protein [Clostridia bacterium]